MIQRKGRDGAFWPVSYRWLATGTLIAYSAVGISRVALAQDRPDPARGGEPNDYIEALPVRRFEIPAGPLGAVMDAFAAAGGVRWRARDEGIRMLPSPGVSGLYTVEMALRKLLEGTGVMYRFPSARTVVLDLESFVTSVDVTAAAPSQLETSSLKYAAPLRDTPQTVSVVSREVLDQQGTTTLRDALRNVAGISLAAGEGGAQGDNLTIRGFTARNDLFIDGMRDFGSYYRDPFNTEEVEVLQGPSSMTFGRGSTGGVVNQATKTPQMKRSLGGEFVAGTDRTRRATLDVNRNLPRLADGAAFRLNVMGHEGGVAGRDAAENRRFGVAPSLAFGLGTPTRWTLSYFHQTAGDVPDYGIPWLFNSPAPVDRENYYGFEKGNFLRTYADIGTARFEHDTNPASLRAQVRYADYRRRVQISEARVPAAVTPATPLEAIDVTRNQIAVRSSETFLDGQADVVTRFATGPLQHSLVTGIEAGRETSDPTRIGWSDVPTTSLLRPVPSEPFRGTSRITSQVRARAAGVAGYVLDRVQLGRRWEVNGGVRWDRFDADYRQTVAPAAAFSRVDNMAAWRGALIYKPAQEGSVYFSASTSFNPSAESLSLSAGTADLPPEENRNLEAGTKWDFQNGRLSLRGAAFRTDKLNAREPDPNNPLLNVLAGRQRVDGVEVEARGRLTSRWSILSGYAHLDGNVVASNYYPGAVGAQLANVPKHTFNFWTNYRFPRKWDAGLGANHVSSRTASSTAPLDPATGLVKSAPGYWVFDAMVSHALAEHVDLQVNVKNLTNRYYYDLLHPGHIVLGPGRSATAGLAFKF